MRETKGAALLCLQSTRNFVGTQPNGKRDHVLSIQRIVGDFPILCAQTRGVCFARFFYGYCDDSEERIREEGTATSFVYLRERIKRFIFLINIASHGIFGIFKLFPNLIKFISHCNFLSNERNGNEIFKTIVKIFHAGNHLRKNK